MRTIFIFFSALVITTSGNAQTVATFDDLALPHADTFYINYAASGTDVGFNDGLAHFPCVYDTFFGGYWSYGFAYSNMTDSVTSGYTNQYSAMTAKGYGGSNNYAVAYGGQNIIRLNGAAAGRPVAGFYVTNSTYAHNSMRDGDLFARKFHNGDWFKLTVRGFSGGALQPDSVGIYLANFLFPDSSMNYILKTWQWVNLLPLGSVDSLQFTLSSTDNGLYGMNTPAYFCIDNFTTQESSGSLSVKPVQAGAAARVYPNPATGMLYLDVLDSSVEQVTVLDMTGNIAGRYEVSGAHLEMNISGLQAGLYVLQMNGERGIATARFVKR